MGTKNPNIHVLIVLITVTLGFIENRPMDAFIIVLVFSIVSIVSYIPFVGFIVFMSAINTIMELMQLSNSLTVATAYWATTIWSFIVCAASTAFVVLRILRR